MHRHIYKIVNVFNDGNYKYHTICELIGKGEKNQMSDNHTLIKELNIHKNDYVKLHGSLGRVKVIYNT